MVIDFCGRTRACACAEMGPDLPSFRQNGVTRGLQDRVTLHPPTKIAPGAIVKQNWTPNLRAAAILTALVLPGGCIALLAVALVKKLR